MTKQTAFLPAQPRMGLLRLIAEHNPFYLISASCMLLGCLLLTNSLSWDPIAVPRLLVLIVTLNVYEIALVGLGLYLIARRGLRRDGWMLLVLEAFFLVDVTFLNAEIVTADFRTGMIVNIILFVQAMAKLFLILHVLRPKVTMAQIGFVAMQMLALFALPCVMRRIDHGSLSAGNFYAAWWIIGMLPVAYECFDRIGRAVHRHSHDLIAWVNTNGAPTMLYMVLPYLSLLLHLSILHYVYDVRFFGAEAAPVLLALAVVANRVVAVDELRRRQLAVLRVALPLAAILVSGNAPEHLAMDIGRIHVTTLKLAVVGAYLVYVYCFLLPYAAYFLGAAALTLLAMFFGPAPSQVYSLLDRVLMAANDLMNRLVPRTTGEWGVVGLAASFAFLILGAAVSLLKSPVREKGGAAVTMMGNAMVETLSTAAAFAIDELLPTIDRRAGEG